MPINNTQVLVSKEFADLLKKRHKDFDNEIKKKTGKELYFTDFTKLLAMAAVFNKEMNVYPVKKNKRHLAFDFDFVKL